MNYRPPKSKVNADFLPVSGWEPGSVSLPGPPPFLSVFCGYEAQNDNYCGGE